MSLVRTTVSTEDQAKAMARRLIKGQDACCVHLQRIESTYMWEGEMQEEGEWLVEARVPAEKAEATWAKIMKQHPFDVPLVELIAETRVNGKYAQWARGVTGLQD